jgi:hypothetical protein
VVCHAILRGSPNDFRLAKRMVCGLLFCLYNLSFSPDGLVTINLTVGRLELGMLYL